MIPLRIEPTSESRAFRQVEGAGFGAIQGERDPLTGPTQANNVGAIPFEAPAVDAAVSASGFEGVFTRALADASTQRHEVDAKIQALASGAEDDLHGTMIAVKEAEISTRMIGTIRNKLLDAFQELWRTSV